MLTRMVGNSNHKGHPGGTFLVCHGGHVSRMFFKATFHAGRAAPSKSEMRSAKVECNGFTFVFAEGRGKNPADVRFHCDQDATTLIFDIVGTYSDHRWVKPMSGILVLGIWLLGIWLANR